MRLELPLRDEGDGVEKLDDGGPEWLTSMALELMPSPMRAKDNGVLKYRI
jgi:hypothetical protein